MLNRLLLSGVALAALTGIASAQMAPAPAEPAAPAAVETPAAPSTDSAAAVDPAAKADPNLFSNIKGADVIGENDQSIGSIADVLVDSSGQLKSLVISHGGIVGIGKTYRQYEVSALPTLADGKASIAELNTAALEGIPEYTYPEAETGRAATDAAPADPAAPAPDVAASSGADLWPVSYIVGATVGAAEDKASVSDVRLEGDKVGAVLIDKGSLGLGNKVQEVAFSDLDISGSPAEPKIALKSGAASAPVADPAASVPAPAAP
jgi:hypothetical protein